MYHRSGSWVKGHYRNGTWVEGHYRKGASVSGVKQNNFSFAYGVNRNLEKTIIKEKREVEYFIKKLKEDNPNTNSKSFDELRCWWKNTNYKEKQKDKMEYMRQLTIKEKRMVKIGKDKVQPYKPFVMPDFYPNDNSTIEFKKKLFLKKNLMSKSFKTWKRKISSVVNNVFSQVK